ncbi:MAG: retention module-containing protein, partial [Gammaproteobacteria bacterium]|nr:retention module-containing protein [Gammaproteobacteria bacterium]
MATTRTATQQPMAIGEVQSSSGHVVAVGADGIERRLFAGDLVYAGDLVRTVGNSTVVISLNDGTRFDLGREAEAQLDESVYSTDVAAVRAAALAEIEEIQRAIAAGADPTAVTDPTAAGTASGPGVDEAIQEGVTVDRTGRVGLVEAGYETNGIERAIEPREYLAGDIVESVDAAVATAVNDAPVAIDDNFAVNEDAVLNGTVATNDTLSPDGGNVFALATNPANGVVVMNADGSFTYTPAADYNGPDSFTYTLTDVDGDVSTATVNLTVDPTNDVPVAIDDSFNVNEDAVLNGTVATNDTLSPDGGNVFALATNATNGVVVMNADGSFTYTPAADYNGPDSFTYTLTDADGDVSTATVNLTVDPTNDVPVAVNDSFAIDEDGVLNATVAPNDVMSADGGNTFALTANATNGNVVMNPDGTFSYVPAPDFNGIDTFTYSITDVDGDVSVATATINVTAVDDAPVVMPLVDYVSEEGLFGGLEDSNPVGVDTTDASRITGTMNLFDPDGDPITSITLTAPPDGAFSAGGVAVTWSGSGSSTLVVMAGGDTVATLTIDTNGNYTFDLQSALDHVGDAGQEGVLNLGFGVDVTAGGQTTSLPAALTIVVEDDSPAEIAPGSATVPVIDTNLLIVLDTSGSMTITDGVNGTTRLASAIQSINNLLDSYEDLGMVKVRLVTFSSGAQEHGSDWLTVDEARVALAGLSATGATNYDAALDTARAAFTDPGAITGAQNVSYFFSDGEPNSPNGSAGINAQEETEWRDFLVSNEINSFAIGIGSGLSSADPINPIAYDGQGARDTDGTLVTDFAQLDEMLAGTVLTTTGGYLHASGDIGGGSLFGADGGHIQSITAEGTTYTFDPDADTVTVSGVDRSSFDAASDVLTITTIAGGVLTVDLARGMYSYTAPSGIDPSSGGVTVDYTVVDRDGDTASSTVSIEVVRTNVQIDSGTFSGTDDPDLLIGRPVTADHSVTGAVAAGNTFNTSNNQFSFTFDQGLAGVSIAQISINLRGGVDGDALFDTAGSGSYGPTLGALVGLNAGDISFSPASGEAESPVLTIDFADGSFGVGDTIRFGVDTDNLGNDTGADFASRGVVFTVTFSDGSIVTVPYTSDGAAGSTATATAEIASDGAVIDGLGGDDVIVGTDLDDTLSGGDGVDQIRAEGGNDILVGGSGDDILTGGTGSDTFVWNDGDGRSGGFPSVDTVTDFALGEGDALDLHDLLQ